METNTPTIETKTFNRGDGRKATIEVDPDTRTFKLFGRNFELELRKSYDEGREYAILGLGEWADDRDLGTVSHYTGGSTAVRFGITCEDADPYIAAAKLLCRTI